MLTLVWDLIFNNQRMKYILSFMFFIVAAAGCEDDPLPPPSTPAVETTTTITSLTRISAVCGGNVTGSYGAAVTEKGICWSGTSSSPSVSTNKITAGGSGEGSFSCTLTGLIPARVYYFRAYAINNTGIAYGTVYSFKTLN
jgi:hypothetical protein